MTFRLEPDQKGEESGRLAHLPKPFLRTSQHLRIYHLQKYISGKLQLDDPKKVEILCNGESLGQEMNLQFIRRTRWVDQGKDLALTYRLRSKKRL